MGNHQNYELLGGRCRYCFNHLTNDNSTTVDNHTQIHDTPDNNDNCNQDEIDRLKIELSAKCVDISTTNVPMNSVSTDEERRKYKKKNNRKKSEYIKRKEIPDGKRNSDLRDIVDEEIAYLRREASDEFTLNISLKNLNNNLSKSVSKNNKNNIFEFQAKIYISTGFNKSNLEQFVNLGNTALKKLQNKNIEFTEKIKFVYQFGKSQVIKIEILSYSSYNSNVNNETVSNTNLVTNEFYINVNTLVTEKFDFLSLPFQFQNNDSTNITKDYLRKNTYNSISSTSEKNQKLELTFERNIDNEPELGLFLEFNYLSMSFLANKLYYIIYYVKDLKEYSKSENRNNDNRKEIFRANQRYGKNPIYFNPSYLLKSFLEIYPHLIFEFNDRNGYVGEFTLSKIDIEYLMNKSNSLTVTVIDKLNTNSSGTGSSKAYYFTNFSRIGKAKIRCKKTTNQYFLDYLNNGLDINFAIGIDYTSSNLDPQKNNSLHTLRAEGKNHYENAIRSFGNILSNYDKSNLYPVLGFGGVPIGKNLISHCFNVNGLANPNIEGVENVIKTYKESLKKVKLLGPTKFSLLIKAVLNDMIKLRKIKENEVREASNVKIGSGFGGSSGASSISIQK